MATPLNAPDLTGNRKPTPIECLEWRSWARGTLLGFAKIHVPAWHLTVDGVAIHEKNGRRWAQLPARPQLDKNHELIHEPDGKVRYAKILDFDDRNVADRFGLAVVRAVAEFSL